jgi:hypothetical protein
MSAALALAEAETAPVPPTPKADRFGIVGPPDAGLRIIQPGTLTGWAVQDHVNLNDFAGLPATPNTGHQVLNALHQLADQAATTGADITTNGTGYWLTAPTITGNLCYNAANTATTTTMGNVEIFNNGTNEVVVNLANGTGGMVRIAPGSRIIFDSTAVYTTTNTIGTTTTTWDNQWNTWTVPQTKQQKFLQQLKAKLAPAVLGRQKSLRHVIPGPELKARQTLREMLLESEYRRYLTNGFIMVRGQSGKWYQIFNDQRRIQVYENNKLVSRLCIYTSSECPPTDHVINMKLLAELDEDRLWSGSNIYDIVPGNEYGRHRPQRGQPVPPQADANGNLHIAANVVVNGYVTIGDINNYQVNNDVIAGVA